MKMKCFFRRIVWMVLSLLIVVGCAFAPNFADSKIVAQAAGTNFDDAKNIKVNTEYTDNLATSSEKDYFKFTISSDSKISVAFSHDYIDSSFNYWYLELYNSKYERIDYYYYTGNKKERTGINLGVPSGVYYIMIKCSELHSSVDYRIKVNSVSTSNWEKEVNNNSDLSTPITLNNDYYGSLTDGNDKDYYKFTLNSNSKVCIVFSHDYIDSSFNYWYLELYNSKFECVDYYYYTGNKKERTGINLGLPSGVYYIMIKCSELHSSLDYKIKVNSVSTSNWEKELNNNPDLSTPITLNKDYNGSLKDGNDKDYYKFTLNSNSKVCIVFSHDYIDSSFNYWYLELYNSKFERVDYYYYAGNKKDRTGINLGLPSGVYYIMIKCSELHSSLDYKIKVNSVSTSDWEKELNNLVGTATKIDLNEKYYGSLIDDRDVDYYTFTTVDNKGIKLQFDHDYIDSSYNYWCVNIYSDKDTSKSIFSYYVKGNQSSSITDLISLTKGTYYLRVEDSTYTSTNDYCFKVIGTTPTIDPISIALNQRTLSLEKGKTFSLTATITPSNTTNKTITWSSSNTSVATVSGGKVTAKAAGTATITAKTNNGKTATCTVTVVAPAELKNSSTISATSVAVNAEVTLNGKASGGTSPYKYAYYYKKSTDSTWTKAYVTSSGSAYTKYDSVTFKPTTAGTYNVKINVKDQYGEGQVVSKEFTLTVKAALKNSSTISSTSVNANTEVTLNGKASGGTSPYKYAYYYKKSTDSTWTKAYVTSSGSAYTKYDSVTFKPTTAGTYNVKINVKDQYGEGQVVSKEFTLTVKAAAALKNSSTMSATSVTANTEVTLNGKAKGGTSPYKYAYYYKKSTDSAWTKAYVTSSGSAYTKYDSVTFKPTTAGTYNVRINVKDKYGEGDVVSKEFTLTVKAASSSLKNSSTISASTTSVNNTLVLTGKASGGTSPYKYAYYYKKSTETSWKKIVMINGSAYSSITTVTFTPDSKGKYDVRVNVKDSSGSVAQKDFTVTVT